MAHYSYTIELNKKCPRCGSSEALVSVYHFGATFQPQCNGCGLNDGKGDSKEQAKPIIINCFYEYEKNNK